MIIAAREGGSGFAHCTWVGSRASSVECVGVWSSVGLRLGLMPAALLNTDDARPGLAL